MHAALCLHDDDLFLELVLRPLGEVPKLVLVSRVPWGGAEAGDWERTARIAEACGAEVVHGDWADETSHRRFALDTLKERGCRHVLIPDSDEVLEPLLLDHLRRIAEADLADVVHARMDTYWKSPRYVIRPREALAPAILINVQACEHVYIRDYRGARHVVLSEAYGLIHHLSYAGGDERIARKVRSWSHKDEVVPGWWGQVWKSWDEDPTLPNLHPTHPPAYGFAERIPLPEILEGCEDSLVPHEDPPLPMPWPKVSIVVPLYGGPEEIRNCLTSLEACQDLFHECIVVDDKSPDDAPKVAASYSFIKLLKNKKNLGFAATCNHGYRKSTGEIVLFLNSDTVVPRSGLIRLIETLMSSGSIGAVGPMSNNVGYDQQTRVTYTDLGRMSLFAQDFAHRPEKDQDVSMLVGFCLAVRRTVLEEIGLFDERFGRGLFEDTDLCHRIQRAGYRLRIASRAYVHHEAGRSLARTGDHPMAKLRENEKVFRAKWEEDLRSGFASHLAGDRSAPVTFQAHLHPDRIREEITRLARKADISLCMIVKNEERVFDECLKSVQGVFAQVVVVDTGSTDRTVEIAKSHGAQVSEIPWPDSFAAARNESLKRAKGKWIFWMDADDTMPLSTALTILRAAIDAPPNLGGFVVPVQFVEDGPGAGTRVDHVKLFRNLPGLAFEGRIHEQILPSLRAKDLDIGRLDAVILHSGYDTSPVGQARKRERDWKLLGLDLEERPNHPFVQFNCGMTAHFTGEHEKALEYLQKSIDLAGPQDSHLRKSFALKGISLRELGRAEEAIETFEEGIERVGPDPELMFQKASTLARLGRLEEAKKTYLEMPTNTDGFFSSVDVGLLGFKRLHNLGMVLDDLGEHEEATQAWIAATNNNPRFINSAVAMFESAAKRMDLNTMHLATDLVRRGEGLSERWASQESMVRQRRTGCTQEDALRSLLEEFPKCPWPGMLLARMMLARGQEHAAVPLLERLEAMGVAEAAFFCGVAASRRGDFETALAYMRRSLQLNPGHEDTRVQIQNLEAMVGA